MLYCGYATALFLVLASIHLRKGKGGRQWWWDGVGDVAPFFPKCVVVRVLNLFSPLLCLSLSSSLYPLSLIPAFHAAAEAEKKRGRKKVQSWELGISISGDVSSSEGFSSLDLGAFHPGGGRREKKKRRVHEDFFLTTSFMEEEEAKEEEGEEAKKVFPQLIARGGKEAK